jgi:drug/metabolite transporter (DMT)-like permease
MTRRAWITLLALAAVWGSSYLFIKIALDDLSAPMIVFARTALGALVLLPVAARRGGLARARGIALPICVLAAVQVAGPFVLISQGERWIASSLAGILVAATPIFTALIALGLTGEERANAWSVTGLGTGIAGVALLLGVDAGGSHLALLGAYMVRRRFRSLDPVWLVTATMVVSALLVLPAALATLPSHAPSAGTWASVAVLGVVGTGLAFVLFYTLIQREGPARAAIVTYIAPAFAVVYGVVLRGESFRASTAAGLVLILAGAWLAAEGRPPPIGRPGRMFDSRVAPVAQTGERHR